MIEHERYTLYYGDCLDWLPGIPNDSVDLVLCDLPYGTTRNKWDIQIPLGEWWSEVKRVTKEKGNIVLFSAGLFTAKLILSQERFFRYKMVWVKGVPTNFLNAKLQPMRKHEDICVFGNPAAKYNQVLGEGPTYTFVPPDPSRRITSTNYGEHVPISKINKTSRVPVDVLHFGRKGKKNGTSHPTEKSLDLCRYLVQLYTDEGDTVLDPTMGRGTSLIAANLEGRYGIGMEKDYHWYEATRQRIRRLRP